MKNTTALRTVAASLSDRIANRIPRRPNRQREQADNHGPAKQKKPELKMKGLQKQVTRHEQKNEHAPKPFETTATQVVVQNLLIRFRH